MDQLSLFAEAGQSAGLPTQYLDYRPGIFSEPESNAWLERFIKNTYWQQGTIRIYEKELLSPRLMAWFGDATNTGMAEGLPGIAPWTEELLLIKSKVENLSGMPFNSVLLNYYRDGNDSVAWHSDKQSVPGKTVVASVSFGQVRSFDIRNKKNNAEKYAVRLENGSYLLMKAGFQDHWEHRIAKSTRPMKARVNLTFRKIG